jgi:hypothetical protein
MEVEITNLEKEIENLKLNEKDTKFIENVKNKFQQGKTNEKDYVLSLEMMLNKYKKDEENIFTPRGRTKSTIQTAPPTTNNNVQIEKTETKEKVSLWSSSYVIIYNNKT